MIIFNALFYPFKDGGWIGKTIKNALSMLLLAPPFGYMFRIAQSVSDGNESQLPDTQVGGDFGRGVQILVAFLIYNIPVFLVARLLQPPVQTTSLLSFNLNATLAAMAGQYLVNFLIALPFNLALLVGYIRFITTDNFLEF